MKIELYTACLYRERKWKKTAQILSTQLGAISRQP